MTLIAFYVIIDHFGKSKWMGLLIGSGQNPMIAYVAHSNFSMPILNFIGFNIIIDKTTNMFPGNAAVGLAWSFFYVFLVALFTTMFTKMKLYWRS